MKILFVGGMFPQDEKEEITNNSKIDMQIAADFLQWNLIEGLEANLGKAIDLISSRFVGCFPSYYTKPIIKSRKFQHNEKSNDYAIGFLNIKGIEIFHRMFQLYRPIKKWIQNNKDEKLNIIVYSANPQFLYTIAKIKRNHNNVKITLIIPDLPENMKITDKRTILRFIYDKFFEQKLNNIVYSNMKFVDFFVLLTEEMKHEIKIGNRKYVIVEGVCNRKVIIPSSISIQETIGVRIDSNPKIILYTGTLAKRYGIIDFIHDFMKVNDPNVYFLICGTGDAETAIKKLMKKDNRIKFIGSKPHDVILDLQRNATLLVNPRKNNENYTKYSFPSKTMEYMQSGTPVLMYKLDGIPKEYDDYIMYFDDFNGWSSTEIVEHIINLKSEELDNIGEKAQAFVYENKNIKVQTKKIIDMMS